MSEKNRKNQIVWLRQDLRLGDQGAVAAAAAAGPVVFLYVLDDAAAGDWAMGGASRWWLHHSLAALGQAIAAKGSRLILRRGAAVEVVCGLAEEIGAAAIHATRHVEPWARRQERELAQALAGRPAAFHLHDSGLLFEPGQVKTENGGFYKVFTPFWKAVRARGAPAKPLPEPDAFQAPARWPRAERLADWRLAPEKPNWAAGFTDIWTPGEAGAWARLSGFAPEGVRAYPADRDFPGIGGVSKLSPHLHFGEISARRIWRHLAELMERDEAEPFIRQLGWRDFSANLLYADPRLPDRSWNPKFRHFPWWDENRKTQADLDAWRRGETGYPIIDAALRELWATGWMHNRARMLVGSFLTKNLLLDWRLGEAWFWDTLVDADLGNNAAGWQWVAGSGADAAPYFRIFNPVAQSRRFDPKGVYIRTWLPCLADLPDAYLHAPWEAPAAALAAAGLRLGRDYPRPIVDLQATRRRALDAYERIKNGGA